MENNNISIKTISTQEYYYKKEVINSDTLIISFASHDKKIGIIKIFEFSNFLEKNFGNISSYFFIDKYINSYHNGIYGITSNIDETVEYLKTVINPYKNIICIGTSAGGYAAILFGSLLNITSVIAFIPQTIRFSKNVDEKYRDIAPYINSSTKYYLYGDSRIVNINDCHNINQCERISCHKNVNIIKKNKINIKEMRDNGELYDILHRCINKNF
jgi:hypothetical protein